MKTKILAVVALVGIGATGCKYAHKDRARETARTAEESVERTWDTRETTADSLDGVMRYQVSRVDAASQKIVFVPVDLAEQEIEPQRGEELELSFEEFRKLSGKEDPSLGDVVQSLEEGGEVIIHSRQLGMPNSADDIDHIELVRPE